MLSPKMTLHAAAPAPDKGKIQRAADGRTGQRDQSPSPLFRCFGAEFRGETFGDARGELVENLFLRQVFSVIDAGGSRGRLPHFYSLVVAMSLESVEQRKPLDEPQRDHGEKARIGQKRDYATETESRAFGKR